MENKYKDFKTKRDRQYSGIVLIAVALALLALVTYVLASVAQEALRAFPGGG